MIQENQRHYYIGILLFSLLILMPFHSYSQAEVSGVEKVDSFIPYYKYRVSLKDKKGNGYSLKHPEEFLSSKSIERRNRQGLTVDESDLPISKKYVDKILVLGLKAVGCSKWNNTLVVQTNDTSLMEQVAAMPFVTEIRKVASYLKAPSTSISDRHSLIDSLSYAASLMPDSVTDAYGKGAEQIDMLNGRSLHERGYDGSGMTIAILDGGFYNADIIPMLSNVKILGSKDFANPDGSVYDTDRHGTMVLSCMGTNNYGNFIGTSPGASFYLLRSEDGGSEQLVEEDNWCCALEYADSVGADLVNSSLGYTLFDNEADNVRYKTLDGKTHICSRSASMAASKGMVVCNSAGNSGNKEWKKIGVPADASDILAVGALSPNKHIATFSSVGDSSDGRVKPDVCARGVFCTVIGSNGLLTTANGTSFASPIMCGMVACYWQAHRELTAMEVIDAIRQMSDRFEEPDNIFGYGVPDFSLKFKD